MPPITLYRVSSQTNGVIVRFTCLGDEGEPLIRKLLETDLVRTDGWEGFLEALMQARYPYNGRMVRYHIEPQEIGDDQITWHRERHIEFIDDPDEEACVNRVSYKPV